MAEPQDQPQKPANVPPRDKRPKPKHYSQWNPEEFLADLEEDQNDRRTAND
jgi:hypothetical protein